MTTTRDTIPEGAVLFYGGPFSNFVRSPIVLRHPFTGDLVTYPTVEARFQAMKARSKKSHDRIWLAPGPQEAKDRGRACRLREDWETVKYGVMLEALRAKFAIPSFRAALLDTLDRPILEDSPTDFIWGFRNGGQNLLGRALMEVRAELRADRFTWQEGDVEFRHE